MSTAVKKTKPSTSPSHDLTVDVLNMNGEKVSTRALLRDVFGVPMKEGLVHLAVVAQTAKNRAVHASTKSRGQVRGGGKKPWRQKGTGRARHGSIRSPLWKGGGITFGPRTERNYELKINKKVRRKALCMVLSQKVRDGRILFLDAFSVPSAKTKDASQILKRLPFGSDYGKRLTVGIISPSGATGLNRSLRNICGVSIIPAHSLNISLLLQMKRLIMPLESLEYIEQTFKHAA